MDHWRSGLPADHPLRAMRAMVDEALRALDGRFNEIYQVDGRKVSIRRSGCCGRSCFSYLYSVRSERMLMERCSATCYSGGLWGCRRTTGLASDSVHQEPRPLAERCSRRGVLHARTGAGAGRKRLLSSERSRWMARDRSWAGQKSFQPKGWDDHP